MQPRDSADYSDAIVTVDPPVWPQAALTMKIDVAINKNADVWVLHDQPFPDYLEWIEFDADSKIMTFITAHGKLQDLGIPIHPPMDAVVARARRVYTVYIRDGIIRDMGLLALTVRGEAGQKSRYKDDKNRGV